MKQIRGLVAGALALAIFSAAPAFAQETQGTQPQTVAKGGTGKSSLTANAFLTGAGTSPINTVPITGLVLGNGAGAPTAYAGTSCTNQFPRSLNGNGVATCASIANTDLVNSSITIGTTNIALGATATGLAGLQSLTVTNNQNTSTAVQVTNTNAGTTALAGFVATSDAGLATFGNASTGYTSFAGLSTKAFIYSATALGGIALYADGAAHPITGITNGTEVFRALLGFMVGTTTDPGAGIINVATGLRIANVAALGNVLRGNGTNFVSSALGVSDLSGLGTGVATALGTNVGTPGAFVVNGGALGSPSSAGTMPAFTLGGTVSGGGNNVNNVNIGVASPGTGSFTSLAYSTTLTGTSTNANAMAVGPSGATNPTLQVDASTASAATGLKVKSAAAAAGLALSVISSGANENLTIDAKGSGTITLNGTATGGVTVTPALTASTSVSSPIHAAPSSLQFQSNGSTFAGSINASQQWLVGTTSVTPQTGVRLTINENAAAAPSFTYGSADIPTINIVPVDTTGRPGIALRGMGAHSGALVYTSNNGTMASPTATTSGTSLGLFVAYGYQTTTGAYLTGAGAGIQMQATENYTSTAAGSELQFYTTVNGTAALALAAKMHNSKGFSVGNNAANDPGAGSIATGTTTVGSLPTCAAGSKGARHFVTDANATFTAGIGATVAAGGANNVPVTCDGANWRIGANDNISETLLAKAA